MSDAAKKQNVLDYDENIFVAIPPISIMSRRVAVADLYIKMPTGRMVKVAHGNRPIDIARMERMIERGQMEFLYVHKDDFSNLVSDIVSGTDKLKESQDIPPDIKLAKFFNISETVFAELIRLPLSDDSLNRAIKVSSEIATNLRMKPDFSKAVQVLTSLDDDFTKHSLSTVIVTSMLLNAMDWNSEKVVNSLTNAAFFHDIGFRELPTHLFYKQRIDMDAEEIRLYESHPTRGVQILSSLSFISAETLQAVSEHHEISNGTGFPNGFRLERIYPLARLLSFSNLFAHDLFDSMKPGELFDETKLGRKLDGVYANMFDAEILKAARKVFRRSP